MTLETTASCAAAGIVSSVNRQIQGAGNRIIRDVIQTDAAINPGNSGGPLLDSSGRLIGVNTMIFSPSGGNVGIGFAVPINTVRRVVAQLISSGRVRRGRVGLSMLGDEPGTHIRHALQLPPGVIVHSVVPGSGAAQAGIRYQQCFVKASLP
jgi:S1-C subfamily serine protease